MQFFGISIIISLSILHITLYTEENAMRFVVIGGDAAGMSAASRAKRNRPDMEVTVIEKTMDVSYSA